MNGDKFIPTRRSLLSRLKNWDDQEGWQQFLDIYGKLIHSVAVKAGLTDAEAQDVVQDTAIVVARKIPGFHYDPALGSFKTWLLLITRRRIEKQLKKRLPPSAGPLGTLAFPGNLAGSSGDETHRTATVERIADPKCFDLDTAWDEEWEQRVLEAALTRVKARVKPKQFQMFDLYVLKEWPVLEVARALNVSVTLVYVNKHRVTRLLKSELIKLRDGSPGIARAKPQ